MNRELLMVGVNFVVLLLLQIFLCNTIYLGVYLNIQIYLIFILFLPVSFSGTTVLLLSALMGISVDLLSGDLGLHMAACTAIGYLRPYLLKRIYTNDVQVEMPQISSNHFQQYFFYTGVLILLHHLLLFTLETFMMKDILFIMKRTFVSAVFNITLICIVRLLTGKNS